MHLPTARTPPMAGRSHGGTLMAATEMTFGTAFFPCVRGCRHDNRMRTSTAAAVICPACGKKIAFPTPFCAEYAETAESAYSLYPFADVYGRAFRLIHADCAAEH